MKNDLTCAVVRDLLPSYLEGLTSAETNRAVESHLETCPDCAACKAAMAAPELPAAEEQAQQVDYLKKVKQRNGKRVVLAVLCTVLLFVVGVAAKIFVIGTPAQEQELFVMDTAEQDGVLTLSISTPASATAYWGWTVEVTDGVADIHARSVLVSPLFPYGGGMVDVPLDGIREVRLCGRTAWQDGMLIQERTARLYALKTPYVGNAPALGQIAESLQLDARLGSYTTTLHTSERPYDWTLDFTAVCTEEGAAVLRKKMGTLAPVMLALVENLEQVSWTYQTADGTVQKETVTLAEVNTALPEWTRAYNAACGTNLEPCSDVKTYAASPAALQQLLDITGALG